MVAGKRWPSKRGVIPTSCAWDRLVITRYAVLVDRWQGMEGMTVLGTMELEALHAA
jgi:hypothetical protein